MYFNKEKVPLGLACLFERNFFGYLSNVVKGYSFPGATLDRRAHREPLPNDISWMVEQRRGEGDALTKDALGIVTRHLGTFYLLSLTPEL